MKLKIVSVSLLALSLGVSAAAYAKPNTYYPPERLSCKLEASKFRCEGFNRQYLSEDTTNAELKEGLEETFHFVTAVTYFTPDKSEASIYFTYNNKKSKMVKLKTVDTSIRPDLKHGNWVAMSSEIYVCTAGYMRCPITHLPFAG